LSSYDQLPHQDPALMDWVDGLNLMDFHSGDYSEAVTANIRNRGRFLFHVEIEADFKQTSQMALWFYQGGLSLLTKEVRIRFPLVLHPDLNNLRSIQNINFISCCFAGLQE
jgi:hypothetical protein